MLLTAPSVILEVPANQESMREGRQDTAHKVQ